MGEVERISVDNVTNPSPILNIIQYGYKNILNTYTVSATYLVSLTLSNVAASGYDNRASFCAIDSDILLSIDIRAIDSNIQSNILRAIHSDILRPIDIRAIDIRAINICMEAPRRKILNY